MPNTDMVADPGTAEAQYGKVVGELTAKDFYVAVSSVNNYSDNLFAGVTNNIEAYAQVLLDSRFDLSVVDGSASYNSADKTWTGKIRVVQHTDGKNAYPADTSAAQPITVKVNDNELEFAKQKVYKALSKSSMADIDFKATEMSSSEMYAYFCKYSLNRLKSFYDGYNSCISILAEMGQTTASDVQKALYEDYEVKFHVVESALKLRQSQVDDVNRQIKGIQEEQRKFQEDHDFYKFPWGQPVQGVLLLQARGRIHEQQLCVGRAVNLRMPGKGKGTGGSRSEGGKESLCAAEDGVGVPWQPPHAPGV